MRILTASDVRAALPMETAIVAMRWAFTAYAAGHAVMPPRLHLTVPETQNVTLCMPAYVPAGPDLDAALVIKTVSVFPGNRALGTPTLLGAVLALDPETGAVTALLDGAELTAIRTGAVSALATDLLARREARTLALFGTGRQARTQALGICAVRPIERILVVSREPGESAAFHAFRAALSDSPGVAALLAPARSAAEAVQAADIVCTATRAAEPLFRDADLATGVHINAIGAFRPEMREVGAETVERAALYVDSREAALREAGDILNAIACGAIGAAHIRGEVGDLLTGAAVGRQDADQLTLFKSVGMAVQDAAAAAAALSAAAKQGLGARAFFP